MTVMTKQSRPAYCTRTVRVHVVCLFSKVVCTFTRRPYVCTRTCTYHNNTIFDSTKVRKYFRTKVRKYENIYLRSTVRVVVRVALARYWYSRRLPSKVATS